MAYTRRDLTKGAAVQTTLNGGISSGATSCTITAATGWPDGSPGGFYVVVDPGQATEEKILCSTRSSTTVNFTTRGADGTSAAAHTSGAVIYPCIAAVDLDEANLAVSKLIGLATAVGQIPVVDNTNSFAMVQAKTSGQLLQGNGTTVASVAVSGDATLASGGALTIAANAVTNAKLAGMTRGTVKVGNSGGAASDLALGTSGQVLTSNGTDVAWGTASTVGTLGYTQVTADQTVNASTITDLTSLTSTVTVGASRRVRISGYANVQQSANASVVSFYIYEGSSLVATSSQSVTASYALLVQVAAILTPSTGSHTYKLRLQTSSGSVTMKADAAVSYGPAWILVEDIGT